MAKWTVNNIIIIGAIGILMYFVMLFMFKMPFMIGDDPFTGKIWLAWIVISSLMFGGGILIKIITRKTS